MIQPPNHLQFVTKKKSLDVEQPIFAFDVSKQFFTCLFFSILSFLWQINLSFFIDPTKFLDWLGFFAFVSFVGLDYNCIGVYLFNFQMCALSIAISSSNINNHLSLTQTIPHKNKCQTKNLTSFNGTFMWKKMFTFTRYPLFRSLMFVSNIRRFHSRW